MVTIRGYDVDVDIAGELAKFDWIKGRVRGEKFLACSPFRGEQRPSFAVRLDSGVWIDSGANDEEWKKGNFIKLLSWLRNESYEETEEYLLTEYMSIIRADVDGLRLSLDLSLEASSPQPLDRTILAPFRFRHPYLVGRGIGERIQRIFQVGYDRQSGAVTFPWFNKAGELVNIKFRSVRDKSFWYMTGGQPIRDHLYGLNMLYRVKDKSRAGRVYIVESEIDALTLWDYGFAAVAMGGANLTARQKGLILQSPIRELVIATDNDRAGKRIAASIVSQLSGYLQIYEITLPGHVKDINELLPEEFPAVVGRVKEKAYTFVV